MNIFIFYVRKVHLRCNASIIEFFAEFIMKIWAMLSKLKIVWWILVWQHSTEIIKFHKLFSISFSNKWNPRYLQMGRKALCSSKILHQSRSLTTTISKMRHLRCTFFVHEAISSSWFFCFVRFGNSLHEFLRYPVEIGDKRPGHLSFVITLSVCVLFIDKTQLSSTAPKFKCLLKISFELNFNWVIRWNCQYIKNNSLFRRKRKRRDANGKLDYDRPPDYNLPHVPHPPGNIAVSQDYFQIIKTFFIRLINNMIFRQPLEAQ